MPTENDDRIDLAIDGVLDRVRKARNDALDRAEMAEAIAEALKEERAALRAEVGRLRSELERYNDKNKEGAASVQS